ncbi:hypothetical protein [Methylobacterium frigidaeris]|uniref:Uncharacterized protein n=1 Tax=Methylobacterium frigidaeris TaxID=2038277 RepID=A0AA37M6M0_9HYPH|nr:hypothetical protein [Methylobacterium frigidaeris]GJD64417.1 hypothetical protein MPEAHAMD_4599 [Methylobacterium frigidaeris]
MTDDRIPIVETYRGVGIHAFQPRDRIEAMVKPAIDRVFGLSDPAALARYLGDPTHPPEARLFAKARIEALWQLAAESRELRPAVNIVEVRAMAAGLGSLHWIDPRHYGTVLQHSLEPGGRELPRRDPASAAEVERAKAARR